MKNENIRMIACDIDGTLIPYGETELPEGLFELIDRLCAQGIYFIIASGRSVGNLKELFAPVADRISFICGNGGIYVENDTVIFTQPFERSYIDAILAELHKDDNLIPIIMCEQGFYIVVTGSEAEKTAKRQQILEAWDGSYTEVEDLAEITAPICKLGVYQYEIMPEEQMKKLRAKWKDAIMVCGGGNWMDVTDKDTNKGTALRKILHYCRLTPEQLMVFGDNENDVEMLELAKYSYVMAEGAPKAKKAAVCQCEDVLEVLRELLV